MPRTFWVPVATPGSSAGSAAGTAVSSGSRSSGGGTGMSISSSAHPRPRRDWPVREADGLAVAQDVFAQFQVVQRDLVSLRNALTGRQPARRRCACCDAFGVHNDGHLIAAVHADVHRTIQSTPLPALVEQVAGC